MGGEVGVTVGTGFVGPVWSTKRVASDRESQARWKPRMMAHGEERKHRTPLLDTVKLPRDLKNFSVSELHQLAGELRWDTIQSVASTGGHLGSSLGVVELTVALHYVFDAPQDKIIWDVSHQCYPHKILTGRRDQMHTLRKREGLSGFTKRDESKYDPFGAGHSSTSISAALGMAVANDLDKKKIHNIAVIGDGAITGGMAYEAMNSAGYLRNRMLVILNDNGQVSLPTGHNSAGGVRPSGALSDYTARLLSSSRFLSVRGMAKSISTQILPGGLQDLAKQVDTFTRGMINHGGTLFEELGFYYIGPVDGHNIESLVRVLENIKNLDGDKPIFLHVKTEKGRGYSFAESAFDKYHGVAKFDVESGKQQKSSSKTPAYTSVFSDALIRMAEHDRKVVGITAAMPGGTGMGKFGDRFPERMFDVGIAEQHAVTFAAGLACEGYKPYCAIYSTFLQRGYDQLVHDVALQNLPVRFVLDRAGLVGNDGATHQGAYDLSYLGCIPGLVIMAPSDEIEMKRMLATMNDIDDQPSVIRFPRGCAYGEEALAETLGYSRNLSDEPATLPIGKGRIVRSVKGKPDKARVCLLSIGTRLVDSVKAAKVLEEQGFSVTVGDARYMKPLDTELVRRLATTHDVMITVEEGSIGGFSSHVLHFLTLEGLMDSGKLKFRPMVIPDVYIEHATQAEQLEQAGLNSSQIAATALKVSARHGEVQTPAEMERIVSM
uniref:1-deoxy-D-xylulose-5-phosphate synthase n=1 Tax=Rhodosorus marinus TaxID=101924 RepID=A0A7S3A8L8_9RHOD|mmetsp:Transcript_7278/g.32282  ORF Transcript_7278/g.32282 Transcript_7278/m.32282 type:complete len:719 (+) Transcript_7278:242-2398(+)|eukprot:CAMPEP_0113968508 /NCGR_PEP_ID=MMETSP0011_2-20120614/9584_1 /TAXON_ID=101924 /ORGANISM="Rhodosorus marinus" /LENGTH=718 /DNA_ID=CAMNT_0000981629 /DNA_START=83 /DNA_END=2239 /DNA_ORIENTATION=- /assembly_acc=CAM_ASM_000156